MTISDLREVWAPQPTRYRTMVLVSIILTTTREVHRFYVASECAEVGHEVEIDGQSGFVLAVHHGDFVDTLMASLCAGDGTTARCL